MALRYAAWALQGLMALMLIAGGLVALANRLPHGEELLYVSYDKAHPDIFIIDLSRSIAFNLTNHPADDAEPAWSPDGREIAFTSNRGGVPRIHLMDASGRNVRAITNDGAVYTTPRWSQNGDQIVFYAVGAQTQLFSIRPDGSGMVRLTDAGRSVRGAMMELGIELRQMSRSVSPDGRWFMSLAYLDGQWGIFISEQPNARGRWVASTGQYLELPAWSPDSRKIAFVSLRNGEYDLYVIEIAEDGTPGVERRLTFSRQLDGSPAWRP